ncbi:MAG: hypothetical protein LBU32_31210 [Clostridiales bacterium]|jgi:hypothetical protein|nr:hypothetical protein [Clostridiales bacterium]
MNDNIWLVIWDLDQAFWSGSLLQSTVEAVEDNILLVKMLVDRGIMNSFCSRGDLESVRVKMEEMGIWDHFVFPQVDKTPTPKCERIRQIISNTRLRPQYTLYISGSEYSLKEAAFCLPKLNVTKPANLWDLVDMPEFFGFSDKIHIRLAQYKLSKPIAKPRTNEVNMKFMLQAGMECAIEPPALSSMDELADMLETSNALNLTNSIITRSSLGLMLNDAAISSGIITLKTVFEDMGIVGFYAAQDGKIIHFVFSDKILDMPGIEQWAYSQLRHPEIAQREEAWAAPLDNSPAPRWINAKGLFIMDSNDGEGLPKLLMRGGDELRGLIQHVKKYLPNAREEVFKKPSSICMAYGFLEFTEEQKAYLRENTHLKDEAAFASEMFSGGFDYCLVSLMGERSMIKYVSRDSPEFAAFIPAECASLLSGKFLEDFEPYSLSDDDLDDALQYVCDHIPKNASLIILTIPEVKFDHLKSNSFDSSDVDRNAADYDRRIRYNSIAEDVVARNDNAYLLDIRNYIKSESDLEGFRLTHYDPSVDATLGKILMALMGVKVYDSDVSNRTQSNAATQKKNPSGVIDIDIKYEANIVNGLIIMQLLLPRGSFGHEFSFELMKGSVCLEKTPFAQFTVYEAAINSFGIYWIKLHARRIGEKDSYRFSTPYFVYNEQSVFDYIDPKAPRFKSLHSKHLPELFDLAAKREAALETTSAESIALQSAGYNLMSYFKKADIDQITIVADSDTAPLIMDSVRTSGINVRNTFTLDIPFTFGAEIGLSVFRFEPLRQAAITENDAVLAACLPLADEMSVYKNMLPENAKIYWLHELLHTLSTEYFFTRNTRLITQKNVKIPIIAVKLPNIRALKNPTEDERKLMQLTAEKIMRAANRSMSRLPGAYDSYSLSKVLETMTLPPNTLGRDDIWRFEDRTGNYANVSMGYRRTCMQPDRFIGSVYLFGGAMVFGQGVSDDETIASCLQSILALPLKVVNCSNYISRVQAGRLFSLMQSIPFKQNDLAIIALEEDWGGSPSVPFQFKYLGDDLIKLDALPLIESSSRNGFFLAGNLYSAKGNMAVAKLIRDKIYDIIKLY